MNCIESVWAGFIFFGVREAWRGSVIMTMKRVSTKGGAFFDKLWELLATQEKSAPCNSSVVDCQVLKTDPVLWTLQGWTSLADAAAFLCYSVLVLQAVAAYCRCTIRKEQ